jgi:predicted aspartyl protease
VKVTRFDPTESLIVIRARILGPLDEKDISLAFDTAATQTHIIPDVLDEIGYSPRHGDQVTSVTSAIGEESGYMMRVARVSALGFAISDFRIHVHDLPESLGIQGLLGLSFLKLFNYEVRSIEGRILVARADKNNEGKIASLRKHRGHRGIGRR